MTVEYDPVALASAASKVNHMHKIATGQAPPTVEMVERWLAAYVVMWQHRSPLQDRNGIQQRIARFADRLGLTTADQVWTVVNAHYPAAERHPSDDALLGAILETAKGRTDGGLAAVDIRAKPQD